MAETPDELIERIKERGCPVCGEPVERHDVLGPADIELLPCGHRATEL